MGAAAVLLVMLAIAYGWSGAAMVRTDFSLWDIKKPAYARSRGPHVLSVLAAWPGHVRERVPAILGFLARAGVLIVGFVALGLVFEEVWLRLAVLSLLPVALAARFVIP